MEEERSFGAFFKARRMALKMTLRQFCLQHSLDPGNLSKIERGLLSPPQNRKKLEEYAVSLQLKKVSDEWIEFFDRAAAEAGRIPADLLDDQGVVKKLPILFRTLRGQKVSEEKLNELIQKIRGR
jgi:transcriptional regulator with XRE-family HTH domain